MIEDIVSGLVGHFGAITLAVLLLYISIWLIGSLRKRA